METLDRFTYTETEPKPLGVCPECDEYIYAGDSHWTFDGEMFCNAVCFAKYEGAEKVG